ncbi:dual oxidase 1-like [Babylonia areolata]|uniref:dual oxidase 1-like n=1 Tax=Babylonia areolata TaxID=304850 RepID=UPI003FD580EB
MSRFLGRLLVGLSLVAGLSWSQHQSEEESPPPDGFFNNLASPDWGVPGSRLLRSSTPGYSDGVYGMSGSRRPSPLSISQHVHSGQAGTQSDFGRNAMLIFFGQLVLDELLTTGQPGCPPEYENLDLPSDHPLAKETARPMVYQRSAYDQRTGYSPMAPRQQTNGVTSFLDGGVIYGTSRMWTNHLRSFQDGALKADSQVPNTSFPDLNTQSLPLSNQPAPRDHSLGPVSRLFAIGNAKGHESPFLLALQVVWLRYHNLVAEDLKLGNSNLSDHQVFQAARKHVLAVFQNIAMYEWLPTFLGGNETAPTTSYPGYNPKTRPEITQEFRTAFNFRFSMTPAAVWTFGSASNVPSTTPGRGPQNEARNVTSVRLCNQFWDSQDLVKDHLDDILRGMVRTYSEKEDEIVAPDFRTSFYGPFEYSRQDAVAMEIQRDRDHGLGDLNTVLQSYDLTPISSWDDLAPRAQDLRDLYPNGTTLVNDIDLFPGALLTKDKVQGLPNVFREIIQQQFDRVREADRFWFENGLFSEAELAVIRNITFGDVLKRTTGLSAQDTLNVFTCTGAARTCVAPPALTNDSDPAVDVCSPLYTYDYFSGSQWSFAVSFAALFLVIPGSVGVLCLLAKRREKHRSRKSAGQFRFSSTKNPNRFKAREWQGPHSGERTVSVQFNPKRKKILVRDGRGKELRFIDLRKQTTCLIRASGAEGDLMSLNLEGEVDLILRLEDNECCQTFVMALRNFLEAMGLTIRTESISEAEIKEGSVTRDDRQEVLGEFFRLACLQVSAAEEGGVTPGALHPMRMEHVLHVRLTRSELAEALGMQPSSIFVRNVFLLADTANDGFVSFHDFVGLFGVFLKGNAEEKARLMFNIYDVRRRGALTREDFTKMIRSLLELSENAADLHDDSAVTQLVDVIFREAGIEDKNEMTFEDFSKVFASREYASTLQAATLSNAGSAFQGAARKARIVQPRKTRVINSYRKRRLPRRHSIVNTSSTSNRNTTITSINSSETPPPPPPDTDTTATTTRDNNDNNANAIASVSANTAALTRRFSRRRSMLRVSVQETPSPPRPEGRGLSLYRLTKVVEVYRLHIFWVTLYTLVTCGIFVERAYYYAVGREHAGLRRLSGAWTTAMIRGSASVIMFTYASLLVTMCRNLITRLRETFLHRFVPFDSAVAFHKYISLLAMIATIIHIVGHGTNLYCMCTQSTVNVNCFFREYHTASNGFATFHYWAFMTITGLAGVLVTVLIFVMYVFAVQWARRRVFRAFWVTHSLYPLVYVLTFLHGIGRLVQDPLFPWYVMGPLVIFVLDRVASASRNRIEIPVLQAKLLPSDVLQLVFRRPANFAYRSGQWVRIACLKLGSEEYHPFTLTSAPHERHLTLHIRAVGPWTINLRQCYDKDVLGGDPYPKLYLDGPFGEGHQDWYSCDVAVLVGGGIGVTPFASILKDIAFRARTAALIHCQKVYFLWVTRTQKSFEWMTDVIREVEQTDTSDVVSTHIFVTQFRHKFDLRTTMLYICERHFQKVEGRSLFTGLKATTHFGRPDFVEFLFSLQLEHPQVRQFGVFSCGPGPMTSSVQAACNTLNRVEGYTYTHHYENF